MMTQSVLSKLVQTPECLYQESKPWQCIYQNKKTNAHTHTRAHTYIWWEMKLKMCFQQCTGSVFLSAADKVFLFSQKQQPKWKLCSCQCVCICIYLCLYPRIRGLSMNLSPPPVSLPLLADGLTVAWSEGQSSPDGSVGTLLCVSPPSPISNTRYTNQVKRKAQHFSDLAPKARVTWWDWHCHRAADNPPEYSNGDEWAPEIAVSCFPAKKVS